MSDVVNVKQYLMKSLGCQWKNAFLVLTVVQ